MKKKGYYSATRKREEHNTLPKWNMLMVNRVYTVSCLFALTYFLSLNCQAASIYKCPLADGTIKLTDHPCPKSTNEQQFDVKKNLSWTEKLAANTPAEINITEITQEGENTLVKLNFQSQDALNEFMRTAHKLSGKHINSLSIKLPHGQVPGNSTLQITDKNSDLFPPKP